MSTALADPDAPWHRLEALPRSLWMPALVASVGTAEARLADTARWRDQLLAGHLPSPGALMGDPDALAPLREVVGALGLPGLCLGSEAMTEQVLRTLLWHLDRIADHQPRLDRSQAIARVTADFRATWTLEKSGWERLLAVLQGLGALPTQRWDALAGLLQRREWVEAQRISEHLARLPELQALIARLGRSRHAPASARPAARPQAALRQRAVGLRAITTRLPGAPGEITGVRHGARIEHLVASELAQLHHPVLRKLWRARHAEGRLLSWDSEAVLVDWRPDPAQPPQTPTASAEPESLAQGPVILCLDTSASMRGAPEQIAKAVALAAFRVAHLERRACRLVSFGGPGELVDRVLSLDAQGLEALLDLMGQSFDGGTDVQGPIEHALAQVQQAAWASADLLIVSDGEFGCTTATLDQLDQARDELGLRVQGVLIGDREKPSLSACCDEVFWVRDWRRHADDGTRAGQAPTVLAPSLMATFFPNAISPRPKRRAGG